jgi:antitoxin FitA
LTTIMEPLRFSVPTITLKDIPRDLHRDLKKRAAAHHRSLNKEVIATLRNATADARPLDPAALDESVRRARSLFRRPVTARQIDAWKRAGRL